jgi:hypothetical protein
VNATGRIGVLCWCESTEVLVPVEWLREGRTDSCDRSGCAPGCPSRDEDEDEDHYDATEPVAS